MWGGGIESVHVKPLLLGKTHAFDCESVIVTSFALSNLIVSGDLVCCLLAAQLLFIEVTEKQILPEKK